MFKPLKVIKMGAFCGIIQIHRNNIKEDGTVVANVVDGRKEA